MPAHYQQSMGNGKLTDIHDIIYLDPDRFDNLRTEEMAAEIEEMNDIMLKENRRKVCADRPGKVGNP
ncbi:MAG: hypothetical protein R2727_10345 [Bacteroidales bacterium]